MRARLLLTFVCVCGLIGPTWAHPPLADHLPAGTLFYVGWAGRSLTFDGSATGQLLNEPAIGHLFGAIKALAQEKLTDQQGELFSHAWAMAGIAWQHPVSVALTDLKMGEQGPEPAGVLLIDLGTDRETFTKHLDAIVQSLAEDDQAITEVTGENFAYRVIKGPPGLGDISFGFQKDLFFAAVGGDTAKQLVELTAEKAIVTDKKFAECWKEVGGEDEQVAFYIDVTAILDRIEPLVGPPMPETIPETQKVSQLRKMIDALGVGKMRAVAGSTRIVDRGMYTKTRLFTPAPHRGLLMPLAGTPLSEADLVGVPEDADFVGAIRLSPESLWAEIRRVVREIDPDAETDLLREVARIEKDLDVSISDDLLANLGDTIVLSSAPSQGGFITGTLLSMSLKDPEKLSAAIAKVETYFKEILAAPEDQPRQTTIETTKAGRTDIHYIASTAGFPWPVAPAWAIHKDRVYVAGWPQVIATAIAKSGATKPLTEEANFRKARAKISDKVSVLCYVNSPKIARQTYHCALAGWTLGANVISGHTSVNAKPDWLPALSTLEKYLWPEINAISADEQGITFEGYGSLPVSGAAFMPLPSPLSIAVLLPALNRARFKAKQTVSASNLKNIGYAIFLYMAEHDDQPPQSLDDVVSYLSTTEVYISPLSGREPPKLVDGKLVGELDYILVRVPATAPANLVLAYERPENYNREGTHVIFLDGHVEWMTMPQFEEALKRTQEYLKDQSKPAGRRVEDF